MTLFLFWSSPFPGFILLYSGSDQWTLNKIPEIKCIWGTVSCRFGEWLEIREFYIIWQLCPCYLNRNDYISMTIAVDNYKLNVTMFKQMKWSKLNYSMLIWHGMYSESTQTQYRIKLIHLNLTWFPQKFSSALYELNDCIIIYMV